MAFSGRTTDRLVAIALYAGFGVLVLWAGTALINHSLDTRFNKDFLIKWQIAALAYNNNEGPWPHFSEGDHIRYMDQVTRLMRGRSLAPPESNTTRPYVYRLDRINDPCENIFLLCFSQRIILYGISAGTFARLDKYIDGKADPEKGMFTGRTGKDGRTCVAQWMI